MQFIDSYKIDQNFTHRSVWFSQFDAPGSSDSNLELLIQKGHYPYSYVSDRSKFLDRTLPPLENWRNTLEGGAVSNNETELEPAPKVWEILHCSTLQDYHDGYLSEIGLCIVGMRLRVSSRVDIQNLKSGLFALLYFTIRGQGGVIANF